MSDRFVYVAEFDDEIIVHKFLIVEESTETLITLSSEGEKVYFPNDFFKVAFSREDAILFLSNSYSETIIHIQNEIKRKELEIEELKKTIPDMMFKQRQVDVRRKI